jgi:hypothetical protein
MFFLQSNYQLIKFSLCMCSVSVGCTYNTSMQILYGAEWKMIVRLSHCSIIERGIDSLGLNKNIVHCKFLQFFGWRILCMTILK